MYILKKPVTVFGAKGDVQLMSLSVLKDHCRVRFDESNVYVVRGGKGEIFINGKPLKEGAEQRVDPLDRVAVGDQLMMLRWPGKELPGTHPMEGGDCVTEYQEGLTNNRGSSSGMSQAQAAALEEEKKRIMEERQKWEKEKQEFQVTRNEQEYQRAMAAVDSSILELLPKAKEAKNLVDLMNRVTLSFDVQLEKGVDHIPKVKIFVENSSPMLKILIEPQEFLPKLSLLKDEMMKLRSAIDGGRQYELPVQHDPIFLMFDNDFLLGTATHWPEYLLYNLETDEDDKMIDIKNAAVPYNNVGLLEVRWVPLAGPNEKDWDKPPRDVDPDEDLIGKPWTYRLEILRATDLPVFCEMAYVQYEFMGETFTTEAVQQQTYSPVFDYKRVHHVPRITPEFVNFLKGNLEMQIHITQHLDAPQDKVSTSNPIVVESIQTGDAKGYAYAAGKKPKTEADVKAEQLAVALEEKTKDNQELVARIMELEARLVALEGSKKKDLQQAKAMDKAING